MRLMLRGTAGGKIAGPIMDFSASIAAAGDTDLGEEQLARELGGGALVGDDEHGNARLLGVMQERP